jgi:hypothetical protein
MLAEQVFTRLKETFSFWRRHLAAIAMIAIPFSLLSSALTLLLGAPIIPQEDGSFTMNGGSVAVVFLIRTFAEAALIVQLAAIVAGKPRSLIECSALALAVAPAMLLCNLIVLTGTSLGLMLFIFPGAWIYIRLSLATFIVVLEKANPSKALKQSLLRTQPVQWEMMVSWLMALLALLAITAVMGALLTELGGNNMGTGTLLDLLTAVTGALLHILLFRYYGLTRTPSEQT